MNRTRFAGGRDLWGQPLQKQARGEARARYFLRGALVRGSSVEVLVTRRGVQEFDLVVLVAASDTGGASRRFFLRREHEE